MRVDWRTAAEWGGREKLSWAPGASCSRARWQGSAARHSEERSVVLFRSRLDTENCVVFDTFRGYPDLEAAQNLLERAGWNKTRIGVFQS